MAIKRGYEEIVKLCLEKGADVNATGDKGLTPFLLVVYSGHTKIMSLLLQNDAVYNASKEKYPR